MRDQDSYAPRAVSRRDVAAAWIICCAFAAIFGVLAVAGSNTGALRQSPYAGVYLPGRDVVRAFDSRDGDFEDEVGRVQVPPDLTPQLMCSVRDKALHTAVTSPDGAAPALKC